MNHSYSESENEIEKQLIREIRKNVDSLTNEMIARLNRINALLKKIEKDNHPKPITEHIRNLIAADC